MRLAPVIPQVPQCYRKLLAHEKPERMKNIGEDRTGAGRRLPSQRQLAQRTFALQRREPIALARASRRPVTDQTTPFAAFSLERAVALRRMLRDIKARRLKLSPVSAADLAILTELGLIEIRDDAPVLTQAGDRAMD
jgi:hypothetical protein